MTEPFQVGDFVSFKPSFFLSRTPIRGCDWTVGGHPPMRILLVYGGSLCVEHDGQPYAPVYTTDVELVVRPALKVGDRAVLTRTPRIDGETAPGWMDSKHFLVAGRLGTIREVKPYGYYFEPDGQTWFDAHGAERPNDRPARFCFKFDALEKAP